MSSTLMITAIISGVVFILIALFISLHKKVRNKKLAKENMFFADIVWKNKLEISEKETINECLLAIDNMNFLLLYINFRGPKEEVVLIDLSQVRITEVTADNNGVYKKENGKSILVHEQVNKMQLEITLVDKQPKTSLVLYECRDGMQDLVYIRRRAEHWRDIINNYAKELSPSSRQLLGIR